MENTNTDFKNTLESVLEYMKAKNYIIYTKEFQLNVVGIRTKNGEVNRFTDYIHLFYKDPNDSWVHYVFNCTVDPGLTYMRKLLNPAGAGALVAGQYIDTYAIDKHQGKYDALCQRLKPVSVYRDRNLDDVYNYDKTTIQTGMFGVNIHCAGLDSMYVENWSAACMVYKRKADFLQMMKLAYKHKELYGNVFTYTLIDLNLK